MSTDPHEDLLARFNVLLTSALRDTSQQITAQLSREIREVGKRTAALETKVEDIAASVQEHTRAIVDLREMNETLQAKVVDAENRSRRSNIRIRGLPESFKDARSTALALFGELAPDITPDRLEIKRAHRSITKKTVLGAPRDIIVKLLFYNTKERLPNAARDSPQLLRFQGHN